jgi:hypothetical protein
MSGILIIFLPIEIYVLTKVSRGIDCTSKLILFAFTLNFILRWIVDVSNEFFIKTNYDEDQNILYDFGPKFQIAIQLINSLISRLKWIILYFFVLDMKYVQIKLFSESLEEFKYETQRHKRRICYIFTSFLFLQLSVLALQYTRKFMFP